MDDGFGILVVVNPHQGVAHGVAHIHCGGADEVVQRVGTVKQAQVVINTAIDVIKVAGLLLDLAALVIVAVIEDDAAIGRIGAGDGTEVIAPYFIARDGIYADAFAGLAGPLAHHA